MFRKNDFESLTEETNEVQRHRKVDIFDFFWTVVVDLLAILLYPPTEAKAIARRVVPMIRKEE